MTAYGAVFLAICSIMLLAIPRKYAVLPLLLGVCYMTQSQAIQIGPFSFPVLRLLILVGFIRLVARGEWRGLALNRLDRLFCVWAVWALLSAIGRSDPGEALVFRLGVVYNYVGLYLLFRAFLKSFGDLAASGVLTAVLLIPVSAEMVHETLTGRNLFSYLGGVPATPAVRNGEYRAQGPFRHSILAGTVGGVMFPWMVGLATMGQRAGILGAGACVIMVLASRSSGPAGSLGASILALVIWRWRRHLGRIRQAAVIGYIALDLVMKAPAYYLIARVDIAGGSTGWHRARLIESAIQHLDEWWLVGTDYTRHWMPTGVSWSPDHTDITNHYIKMGVWAGLPLLVLFVLILRQGFRNIGTDTVSPNDRQAFFAWSVGASLFSHAVSCIGVSYFDQSFLFLCLVLASTVAIAQWRGNIKSRGLGTEAQPAMKSQGVGYNRKPNSRLLEGYGDRTH